MKTMCEEENFCVFVANLPANLSNPELAERVKSVLSPFGTIIGVKTSRDLKNRPFAFVQFEGPVVDFMLTEMVMIEDRVLRFEKAKNSLQVNGAAPDNNKANTAGGVSFPPGYNPGSETSTGFFVHPQAYVPYYSFHHQTQQIHTFQVPHQPIPIYAASIPVYQQQQQQQPVAIPKFQSPESYSPPADDSSVENAHKMFIKHLNGELVTQRKLLRRFQRYGHITDIELFKNNLDGSLRLDAFAFISYLKLEQVQEAIKEEDGKEWLGKRLKCCQALKKRGERESGNSSPTCDVEDFEEAENVQICLSQSSN